MADTTPPRDEQPLHHSRLVRLQGPHRVELGGARASAPGAP
ncbi:hypothetical protein [Curtobacterium sp. MCPF17_052]|nr:hypothetical protein [Curtobacterium sp. MCPF17_052]WIB12050.1 hypothetical protein DEJ36_14770 [Curtobacterium sp. MCPF17_052]